MYMYKYIPNKYLDINKYEYDFLMIIFVNSLDIMY